MFTKDTFCILPWSSIQINPSGDFKICCFSGEEVRNHGMAADDGDNVMNVLTHSIKDALNSKNHKALRLAQSRGERHPLCKVCWDRDDANKMGQNGETNSLRNARSFYQLKDMDNAITFDKVQNYLTDDGSIDEIPISLDLRFTNVCNMKCIMCGPIYSNQWYEDYTKLTGRTEFNVDQKVYNIVQENGVYGADMPTWHDSPIWWDKFDEIKHRIRHIYITGGEPFIIKGHDVLLDKLIECGAAKDVTMEYDTNLSVMNKKLLDRLAKFKKIILSVSCDDVGERYELIRFPGKFNRLVDNLKQLQERGFEIRNVSTCVGIYSLYSPIHVHEYFRDAVASGELTLKGVETASVRFLRFPTHTNIAYLPKELKYKMMEVYRDSSLPEYWKRYLIGYLGNNVGLSEEKCVRITKEHIKYLDDLDKIRGTNWKKTLPEIAELLKDYL